MDDTAAVTRYTTVFEGTDSEIGTVIVCIEGEYDLNDKSVVILDHAFHVFRLVQGKTRYLKDEAIRDYFIRLTKTYFYLTEGVVVTSAQQPKAEDTEGDEIVRIDVPDYDAVIIEHCGVTEYNGNMYQVSVAHPGPHVYLVVLLKIVRSMPLTFGPVNVKDAGLVRGIKECYLVEIGAVLEAETPDDEDFC